MAAPGSLAGRSRGGAAGWRAVGAARRANTPRPCITDGCAGTAGPWSLEADDTLLAGHDLGGDASPRDLLDPNSPPGPFTVPDRPSRTRPPDDAETFWDLIPHPNRPSPWSEEWWDEWYAVNEPCVSTFLGGVDVTGWSRDKVLRKLNERWRACPAPEIHPVSLASRSTSRPADPGEMVGAWPDPLAAPFATSVDPSVSTVLSQTCGLYGTDRGAVLERLTALAVNVLLENMDILRWVGCMTDPDLMDCVIARLRGDWYRGLPPQPIHVVYVKGDGSRAVMSTADAPTTPFWFLLPLIGPFLLSGPCRINVFASYWDERIEDFCQRMPPHAATDLAASLDARELCVIAEFATALLHELVHCCAFETYRRDRTQAVDEPGDCSWSYVIQLTTMWALGQRHAPDLTDLSCAGFDAGYNFMSAGRRP